MSKRRLELEAGHDAERPKLFGRPQHSGGGDPSFSGVNLAGASVKVITDGSTLEIPGEHVTATDTQVTIAKSYLDEQDLFASIGDDAEFVFTTANGTASFTCLIAG